MKIAVYAIAKNEAAHVERFMSTAREADLVVVADTGSVDDTVDLLRAAGAVVHEIDIKPWRFDDARNMALSLVPVDVDMCCSLDLDEIIMPGWRDEIQAHWQPGITRLSVDYSWGLRADGTPAPPFRQHRVHARHGYRWNNIVHETLDPIGEERRADTKAHIIHLQDLSKPRTQYLPLLERATQESPEKFQLACWLGREYMAAGHLAEAIAELERYLTIPEATWAPERSAVLRYLATCWRKLGDDEQAMDLMRRATDAATGEREPWVDLARACHDRGLWQEALDAAERALAINVQPQHYLVWDEAWGALPADIASVSAWNLGEHERARQHVIAALALAPDDQRIAANATFMGVGGVRFGDPVPVQRKVPVEHSEGADDGEQPFLVSVTLTGNARDIIGDAISSVASWVDCCLVIDTGVTDDTLELARDAAGEKYRETRWEWINDFAAARNAALDAAADLGAEWAVMLDTDERIVPGPALDTLRQRLTDETAGTLLVESASGTYGKERFFRLPRHGQFTGPTHEAFISDGGRGTLEGLQFIEDAKTPAQYQAKFERDLEILSRHVEEHPDDPRWHYYLGDTLQNLRRHAEAIPAFERCVELPGWDDQAAWAAYRAAECALVLSDPNGAVSWCARGLARHAGVAELAWLAGFASWQAGRPAQAASWARMAIATGAFAGQAVQERIGFRNPMALYEGPYDVLRFALRALGDDEGADEAEQMHQMALAARQAATGY